MRWLLLCMLPALAHAAELDDLRALNAQVNQGVVYLNYAGWDLRDVGAGDYGNCAAIAYTKWKRLEERGYGDTAFIRTCRIWTGEAHAFVVAGGWVLDNLNPEVRPLEDDGCVSDAVNVNLNSLRKWVDSHGDHAPLPQVARQALSGSGR